MARFTISLTAAALVVGVASFGFLAAESTPADRSRPLPANDIGGRALGIDELLGGMGRQAHARRLADQKLDGKPFIWQQYSGWGKELFLSGRVARPPIGARPSKPISTVYNCKDCHNNRREDPDLARQDPEARPAWFKQVAGKSADEPALFLAPATTLWGAVNRESFYNDAYEVYHSLTVASGKEMDPTKLSDAIQVCCQYCSVGRFLETWELDAMIAYLWDLEVRLSDLDLPIAVENAVLGSLSQPDKNAPESAAKTRAFVRRQYLRRAGAVASPIPKRIDGPVAGPYPDDLEFRGDPTLGKPLYQSACLNCHGDGKVNEQAGAALIRDPKRYHQLIAKGTRRDRAAYMPMFSSQRLSRQQIADIQAYLLSVDDK